jgi:hypothetical protein
MTRLGTVISEAIVHHFGRDEFLRRLAHPFWFQSFGAVMGMDWQARRLECVSIGSSLENLMIEEHANSPSYGGRTVFGKAPAAAITASPSRQALRRP